MSLLVVQFNFIISILTVIGQVIIVAAVILMAFKRWDIINRFARFSLPFAFLIALTALSGSLFYSEIAGYEPCKFCWYQRIFMFPLTLLLGLALWKKDKGITLYALPMAILGILLSANHYMLQVTGSSILPCSAVGQSASCGKRFVMNFGYITIPMMALTAFALIIVSLIIYKRYSRG